MYVGSQYKKVSGMHLVMQTYKKQVDTRSPLCVLDLCGERIIYICPSVRLGDSFSPLTLCVAPSTFSAISDF
jgi:hypothetical protein